MTKDEPRYIIAEHEIEEQIQSNFALVLDAVAKELDSICNDMQWRLEHSRKAAFYAEVVAKNIRYFIAQAKEDESA